MTHLVRERRTSVKRLLLSSAVCLMCTSWGFAQSRQVTLNLNDVTIKEAIETLKKESGYSVWLNLKDVELNKRVSVQARNEDIAKVLEVIFHGQNIAYTIDDKLIKIQPKATGQPQKRIKGKVVDANTKEPLTGVTIRVDGRPAGTVTDVNGESSIQGLYAVGESGCTGLHGANRLASNSLLEALVVSKFSAREIDRKYPMFLAGRPTAESALNWTTGNATDSDEQVVITHNWDEIRRFMWDYVGIYRTNKRLERAKNRIKLIRKEIEKYYWDFIVTADLVELRNIATVAELIIDCSLQRHESRGLHYNADYPYKDPELECVDTVIQRKL